MEDTIQEFRITIFLYDTAIMRETPLGFARSANRKRPGGVKPEVIQLIIENGAIE